MVKVVGSNISHKLRLSRVKPSDEGTYECRVIDFSDVGGARHHRVRAHLQVVPENDNIADSDHNGNFESLDDTKNAIVVATGEEHHGKEHGHHQNHGKRSDSPAHHAHSSQQHKAKELKTRDTDSSRNDCSNEASCSL